MPQSLTYFLTLFVLKLKGLKKIFSENPVKYKKLRKEDVLKPKGAFFKQFITANFTISNTQITEVSRDAASNKLLVFIHGGAFISGPGKHHWDTIQEIAKKTNHTIWMCDYPKAPENKISELSKNIDLVYSAALEKYESNHITLLGDSVGGTLIMALTQRLIRNNQRLPLKIIVVSPVMDASMCNPAIKEIEKIDPLLAIKGLVSAKKMCAENNDLKSEMISPLYGSFENFPHTILFVASNDITYPDQLLTVQKLRDANVHLELIEGENMPHIWPFLPVMKEAKTALNEIIGSLNITQEANA
jgi:acetyl esterase/lipase